jgi:hypothetical protein
MQNSHIQTVYSSLFRKLLNLYFVKKQFHLSDGDFLECYWHNTPKQTTNTPLVILFHGLAGSYESPYIQGVVQELSNNGFNSVLMHFRGCTGEDNKLPRSYHSGDTGDALEFIKSVKMEYKNTKLYTVAYSLGANMLLKLLGEIKKNSLIEKAVAVSPPLRLDICAKSMNRGLSKYYQHRLLKDLKFALDKKYDKHDMESLLDLKREDISKLNTFEAFDSVYTAPIHGFKSAQDYYIKCSSRQYLKDIETNTLIIHAKDDPFMSEDVIPTQEELSSSVELQLLENGGHVGFIAGSFFSPVYWLEKRIVSFLLE